MRWRVPITNCTLLQWSNCLAEQNQSTLFHQSHHSSPPQVHVQPRNSKASMDPIANTPQQQKTLLLRKWVWHIITSDLQTRITANPTHTQWQLKLQCTVLAQAHVVCLHSIDQRNSLTQQYLLPHQCQTSKLYIQPVILMFSVIYSSSMAIKTWMNSVLVCW